MMTTINEVIVDQSLLRMRPRKDGKDSRRATGDMEGIPMTRQMTISS